MKRSNIKKYVLNGYFKFNCIEITKIIYIEIPIELYPYRVFLTEEKINLIPQKEYIGSNLIVKQVVL